MASEIGERLWGQACDDAASTGHWSFVKSLERPAQTDEESLDDSYEVEFLEGLIDYAIAHQAGNHVIAVLKMELDIIRRQYTAQSETDKSYLERQKMLLVSNNQELYEQAVLLRHSYSSQLLKKHETRYPLDGTQRVAGVQDTD